MSASRMAVVLAVLVMAAMVCGCAATGGRVPAEEAETNAGPMPAGVVKAVLADVFRALKAGEIEKVMAAVSDDYSAADAADKSALRLVVEGMVAQGFFADATINMGRCQVAVDGDSAVAGPVAFESYMGNSAQEYRMRREGDGVWRIVSGEPILPPDVDIWTASSRGYTAMIEQHVSAGTDLNASDPQMGITPLNAAALLGQAEAAGLLVEGGADVNGQNRDGNTPLHTAAFFGHIDTVSLLLAEGADPNVRDQNGQRPLDVVSGPWNPELEGLYRYIGELLQLQLDLGEIKGARPVISEILAKQPDKTGSAKGDIWSAAGGGDIEAIRRHLSAGTDLNAMDPAMGNTPLLWAAIFGRTEAAGMLIEGDADVNAKGRDGSTALHAAAFYGHTETVKLLLENGADVNVRNQNWLTPLESVEPAWSPELEGIYQYIGQALRTELDLESIKAARPVIADLLRGHGG